MVASNPLLYSPGEHPDHCVVIKYIPAVGDSKRAMDEYSSEIFLGGRQTIVMHNTCEDSLLAAPIILDLVILTELLGRIQVRGVPPLLSPPMTIPPCSSRRPASMACAGGVPPASLCILRSVYRLKEESREDVLCRMPESSLEHMGRLTWRLRTGRGLF